MDTHYVKRQEQQRKLHYIGILRDIEGEAGRRERGEGQYRMRSIRRSWNEVKGIAGDRNVWKLFMHVLCSTRSKSI